MKYVLIDSPNLFFKSSGAVLKTNDIDLKIGLSINIFLTSMYNIEKNFQPDHYVICLDSKSWRYKFYEKYKMMRRKKFLDMTNKEKEEYNLLIDSFNDLIDFFENKTNVSVLKCDGLEADDLISFWIKKHNNCENIIISSDSDYIQLLKNQNTFIYNNTKNVIISKEGCFNFKGKNIPFYINSSGKISFKDNDNKVNEEDIISEKDKNKIINWYEWALFLKIIRGDSSDGIEAVVPKVKKDTLKKVFNDMEKKGFEWNKFMYNEIIDLEGNKTRVIDKYKLNKMLIDLSDQPDDIKILGENYINNIRSKKINQIGFHFLKFCNKYELKRIENNLENYVKFLSKRYINTTENNEK